MRKPAPAPSAKCLCPDYQIPMTPAYAPLAPGATASWSWVCPQCRIERMWPDPAA